MGKGIEKKNHLSYPALSKVCGQVSYTELLYSVRGVSCSSDSHDTGF